MGAGKSLTIPIIGVLLLVGFLSLLIYNNTNSGVLGYYCAKSTNVEIELNENAQEVGSYGIFRDNLNNYYWCGA